MENPFKKIFSMLKLKTKDGTKPTKIGYILIIGLIGILVLLVANMFQGQSTTQKPQTSSNQMREDLGEETFLQEEKKTSNLDEVEKEYESELQALLEKIDGVSGVEVMVNLDATQKQVYEKNLIVGTQTTEETDQNGGERKIEDTSEEKQVVIVRQGEEEVPLLIQTKRPEVRGVLVVAQGVNNLEIEQWVTEAVSRVLDVPVHRISVMPKNKGEES
ncbi:stage III sporulation protein AG [Paraliobacillus ryukyuensis]|uniref:stage III sporulation protein AG n=1 Tax=Paraliobacillus ryukyuensis TaxID=200904 RepID=UPI0009A57833|nr:stage III sporulation protein AG [Paraliobacillus ryukyuensis]